MTTANVDAESQNSDWPKRLHEQRDGVTCADQPEQPETTESNVESEPTYRAGSYAVHPTEAGDRWLLIGPGFFNTYKSHASARRHARQLAERQEAQS